MPSSSMHKKHIVLHKPLCDPQHGSCALRQGGMMLSLRPPTTLSTPGESSSQLQLKPPCWGGAELPIVYCSGGGGGAARKERGTRLRC